MSFLFPTLLTIGLPLIAVPLLIHLINLRRQQRIKWAAMQFLLESQRRNRRWVMLKQLLLLAMRMAAICLLVLMLSQLVLRNEWMSLLGRGTTHHLVLLDDSYSMSDRWNNTTAFDEAKRAVQSIVDQASGQSDAQVITLLKFSEAAKLSAGTQPAVFSESINQTFRGRLESLLTSWDVSQTDVGPADALKAVPRLPLAKDDQTLILYLVSDFRARQFESATEIRKLLEDLQKDEKIAQTHLIRSVTETRPNLAITALEPMSGVMAAGIEMWMNVTVRNYSDAPAEGVTVQLEQDGDALPAMTLKSIPAGEELSHKFLVQFAGVGAHSLTASLGPDAVEVDNRRYFACDLPAARPVLIIDGSKDGRGGRQLSLALAPGGNTRTGWQPHVEPPRFLSDTQRLNEQAAVILLDVPRLNDDELASLEAYVRGGGGLALFTGAETDRSFYNERFHANGEGLFPVPLKLPTQLMDQAGEAAADLEVSEHSMLQVLSGSRNGLLPLILVDYYYAVPDNWSAPIDSKVRTLAKLRNGAPLVVEKPYGEGRVIAHLTKLSSGDTQLGRWSNWSSQPAFPILANELVSYLASSRQEEPDTYVGDTLVVKVAGGEFEPAVRFLLPSEGKSRAEVLVDGKVVDGEFIATLAETNRNGAYEAQLQPLQGELQKRTYAVNVINGEGDLAIEPRAELVAQLEGIPIELHDAADMTLNPQQIAGFQMSDALLGTLLLVLVAEQLLAYKASYHVTPARGGTR